MSFESREVLPVMRQQSSIPKLARGRARHRLPNLCKCKWPPPLDFYQRQEF
jgi:hypothetical protein